MCIQLRANVTMPDMQISTDVLDFERVKCGECKVVTVQIYNHKHVRCEWNSLPSEKDKKKVRAKDYVIRVVCCVCKTGKRNYFDTDRLCSNSPK